MFLAGILACTPAQQPKEAKQVEPQQVIWADPTRVYDIDTPKKRK